jgi:hypothetical protein
LAFTHETDKHIFSRRALGPSHHFMFTYQINSTHTAGKYSAPFSPLGLIRLIAHFHTPPDPTTASSFPICRIFRIHLHNTQIRRQLRNIATRMIAALGESALVEMLAHQNLTRHQLDGSYTQILDDLGIPQPQHVEFLGLVQNFLAHDTLEKTIRETKVPSSIETLVYRFIQVWGANVWGELGAAGDQPATTSIARCEQVTERL